MPETKEKTALNASVGADAGQSSHNFNNSIPIFAEKSNENFADDSGKSVDEMLRDLQRLTDPAYLPTVTMRELFETVYLSKPPIIEGLLYPGTYLFVGAPKVGKSFLMAQLAYHIGTGAPLWGYPVRKGTVLYLALEDDYRRLQERMFRMFGTEETENLHFATCAKQLGNGLQEQLQMFVRDHPDTKLIIIDTLQKIREAAGEKYSYANDYEIIGQLKRFSDQTGVCLLLVHHTRKQQADDKFDMISGTNGLVGAADGAFVIHKEKRTGQTAILEVSGRDQPEQKLILKKNPETLVWELEERETELWKEPPDPILGAIAKLVCEENPQWIGTPTELAKAIQQDLKPNALSRHLNVRAGKLRTEYGISYSNNQRHAGRQIIMSWLGKPENA